MEPQKLSPVCIQYDTTDVNLDLTVYSYILRCCVYPFFFTEAIASVAAMDATPFPLSTYRLFGLILMYNLIVTTALTLGQRKILSHIYIYVSPLHNADLIMVNSALADKMTVMTSDSSFY